MADAITLDDILRKQKAMADRCDQLQREQGAERIQAIAEELRVDGEELSRMAQTFAEQHGGGESKKGFTVVALTAAQKQRIADATGVTLDEIRIPDDAGIATRTMPHTDPRIVEHWATLEAKRVAVARESEAQLKAQLSSVMEALEQQGNPALDDQLAELKADPKFLGGLLKK